MKTQPGIIMLTSLATLLLAFSPSVLAQTEPPASPSPIAQPSQSPQMQSQMAAMEPMKRMADMCQQMMQKEKAAMPFIIGTFIVFGLLLFIALVLFVVLEVQWIKYWSRILKGQRNSAEGNA